VVFECVFAECLLDLSASGVFVHTKDVIVLLSIYRLTLSATHATHAGHTTTTTTEKRIERASASTKVHV
jgi:hypothetical protein